MRCLKHQVLAVIVTPSGEIFTGRNDIIGYVERCPRDEGGFTSGEGYALCESVCDQEGHAEIMAIRAAGVKANGAKMYIHGHTYACGRCQLAIERSVIASVEFIK